MKNIESREMPLEPMAAYRWLSPTADGTASGLTPDPQRFIDKNRQYGVIIDIVFKGLRPRTISNKRAF